MIQIIFGKKGSGKTKRILDMANTSIKEAKGNVLFVDDDKSYTLSLKPQIRFIDASEYAVKGEETFYGFLAGILAGNYDISVLYVDAFLKLVKTDAAELVDFSAAIGVIVGLLVAAGIARAAHDALEGVDEEVCVAALELGDKGQALFRLLLGEEVQAGGEQAAVEQHVHRQHEAVGVGARAQQEIAHVLPAGGGLFAAQAGRRHDAQLAAVEQLGHE